MIRTTILKIKRVCANAFMPRVLRGSILCAGKFEKFASIVYTEQKREKSSDNGKGPRDSASKKELKDAKNDECRRIIAKIFSDKPEPEQMSETDEVGDAKHANLNLYRDKMGACKFYKNKTADDNFATSKLANDKSMVQFGHEKVTDDAENIKTINSKDMWVACEPPQTLKHFVKKPDVIQPTNTESETKLVQKLERVEEIPLVEAGKPPLEELPQTLPPNVDNAVYKQMDEVAKRCLKASTPEIDEMLLKEMENIGVSVIGNERKSINDLKQRRSENAATELQTDNVIKFESKPEGATDVPSPGEENKGRSENELPYAINNSTETRDINISGSENKQSNVLQSSPTDNDEMSTQDRKEPSKPEETGVTNTEKASNHMNVPNLVNLSRESKEIETSSPVIFKKGPNGITVSQPVNLSKEFNENKVPNPATDSNQSNESKLSQELNEPNQIESRSPMNIFHASSKVPSENFANPVKLNKQLNELSAPINLSIEKNESKILNPINHSSERTISSPVNLNKKENEINVYSPANLDQKSNESKLPAENYGTEARDINPVINDDKIPRTSDGKNAQNEYEKPNYNLERIHFTNPSIKWSDNHSVKDVDSDKSTDPGRSIAAKNDKTISTIKAIFANEKKPQISHTDFREYLKTQMDELWFNSDINFVNFDAFMDENEKKTYSKTKGTTVNSIELEFIRNIVATTAELKSASEKLNTTSQQLLSITERLDSTSKVLLDVAKRESKNKMAATEEPSTSQMLNGNEAIELAKQTVVEIASLTAPSEKQDIKSKPADMGPKVEPSPTNVASECVDDLDSISPNKFEEEEEEEEENKQSPGLEETKAQGLINTSAVSHTEAKSEPTSLQELLKLVRERNRLLDCHKVISNSFKPECKNEAINKTETLSPSKFTLGVTAQFEKDKKVKPTDHFENPENREDPNNKKLKFSCDLTSLGLSKVHRIGQLLPFGSGPSEGSHDIAFIALQSPAAALTDEILMQLQCLADTVGAAYRCGSKVWETAVVEKYRYKSKFYSGKDYTPWSPMPSWPYPKKLPKPQVQCPKHGCTSPPPCVVRDKPCGLKPASNFPTFPRRKFNLLDMFTVCLTDHHIIIDLGEF